MKKRKILLTTSAILIAGMIFPQMAIASQSTTEALNASLSQVLDEYSDSLKKSYYSLENSSLQSALPLNAREQIHDGLTPIDASVTTRVRRIEKASDGYDLHVDITLSTELKAGQGTTIYLAGKPVDSMQSSWTDEHVLHIVPDDDCSNDYRVTTDKAIDPAEVKTLPTTMDSAVNEERTPASLDTEQSSFDANKRNPMASHADFGENSDGLNYIKAINYADKWTAADKMNPAYPVFDQNCANFVSQAIHAGGKPIHQRLWNYSTTTPNATTRFWMNADGNYTYMKHYTNSFTSLANVWDAWEGSLLYVDWTSNGEIDHTMIVVGVVVKDGKANPVIDQKSGNRHQITLTQSLQYAHDAGHNNMTWYGLQYRYD